MNKLMARYYSDLTEEQWYQVRYKQGFITKKPPFNLKGRKVFIILSSKAIGDTLAYFPYIEEFRKKHNCKIIVKTHHNNWFKNKYPYIKFVEDININYTDIYAQYILGLFRGEQKLKRHPQTPWKLPLQKLSSDILGLEYKEIKPKINVKDINSGIEGDYIIISPHATKHVAYWHYEGGWQIIINYLISKGYKVVMLSKEPLGDIFEDKKISSTLKNVINKTGTSIEEAFSIIKKSKGLIGVSSGPAWVSWCLDIPTILISGMSKPYTEMQDCSRIFTPINKGLCNGCWNSGDCGNGADNWVNDFDFCPYYPKSSPHHFECSKTIEPSTVIKTIDKKFGEAK